MKRNLKKTTGILLCAAICVSMAACGSKESEGGSSESSKSGKALEIAYNLATDDFAVLEQIAEDFTKETGVEINIYNAGKDHESAMKTRMASGDLPDMWVTHGWSLIRYSEYLMDLSDQDWVKNIDAGLKEVITNDSDELFILPITQAVTAVLYNKDVLEAAGVDASQIRTWADFDKACKAIKEKAEASPIQICLTESYGSYALENIWPTIYTNADVSPNQAEALKDGSFDWKKDGKEGFEMLGSWYKSGYFNEDYVSCQKDDICRALAEGEGAFSLFSTGMIPSVVAYNPEVNIGVLPVPAKDDSGASYFGIGEGNYSCFGVWKDTKYEAECKQFLEYLAQPEIAAEIVRIDGGIPALTNVELEETAKAAYTTNAYKEAQKQFDGDLFYDNFFDREYLPSGMWSVMADSASTLLADGDPDNALAEALNMLHDNYNDLKGK